MTDRIQITMNTEFYEDDDIPSTLNNVQLILNNVELVSTRELPPETNLPESPPVTRLKNAEPFDVTETNSPPAHNMDGFVMLGTNSECK